MASSLSQKILQIQEAYWIKILLHKYYIGTLQLEFQICYYTYGVGNDLIFRSLS